MKRLSIVAALLLSLNACQAVQILGGAAIGSAFNETVMVPQLKRMEASNEARYQRMRAANEARRARIRELTRGTAAEKYVR